MGIQRDTTSEITRWTSVVSDAALTFQRRWTDLALRRIDSGLARLLHEQIAMFDDACMRGTTEDVARQGAATCRGYAAAVRAMEAAKAPDDAYQLGTDPQTGFKVAIGHHKGIRERVQELHGEELVCVTPDEVAVMMASVEAMKGISAIKKMFPGAEMVRKYQDQGS